MILLISMWCCQLCTTFCLASSNRGIYKILACGQTKARVCQACHEYDHIRFTNYKCHLNVSNENIIVRIYWGFLLYSYQLLLDISDVYRMQIPICSQIILNSIFLIDRSFVHMSNQEDELWFYDVYLSHGLTKGYVRLLIEKGLMEYLDGERTFKTTDKGINFLRIHHKYKN